MSQTNDPAATSFHLDKRIPVFLIGAMCVQVVAVIFAAGVLLERFNARFERSEARLTLLEQRMESVAKIPTDVAVIKNEVGNITKSLERIADELTARREKPGTH